MYTYVLVLFMNVIVIMAIHFKLMTLVITAKNARNVASCGIYLFIKIYLYRVNTIQKNTVF